MNYAVVILDPNTTMRLPVAMAMTATRRGTDNKDHSGIKLNNVFVQIDPACSLYKTFKRKSRLCSPSPANREIIYFEFHPLEVVSR